MSFFMRIFFLCLAFVIGGCQSLPSDPPKEASYAVPAAEQGYLADVERQLNLENKATAATPLYDAREALKWRLALVDNAVKSIDIQYFIWSKDAAGALLFDRLLDAADRGVRVRLLVDDMALEGKDDNIAVYSRHPNFEIRLYNPGLVRKSALGSIGEFLNNFKELNRRMHNKMFVVDNRFAIVGGRNIGNPYFGMSDHYNNIDLDLLMVGDVVKVLSDAYDQYWNAEKAYPGNAISDTASIDQLPALRIYIKDFIEQNKDRLASYPLLAKDGKNMFNSLPDRLITGRALFLQDVPVSKDGTELKLYDMIEIVERKASREIIIVSPYFVPSQGMLDEIADYTARNVKIRIITGSLGSNNHTSVHSHYKKTRKKILATGAELYEFRHDPSAPIRGISEAPPVVAEFMSLHAKSMIADREQVFIGSLNLDPRAVVINSENGIYIESAELGTQLAEYFDLLMSPENAWRVSVDDDGDLMWVSREGIIHKDPARGFGQYFSDFFLGLIPIKSQI